MLPLVLVEFHRRPGPHRQRQRPNMPPTLQPKGSLPLLSMPEGPSALVSQGMLSSLRPLSRAALGAAKIAQPEVVNPRRQQEADLLLHLAIADVFQRAPRGHGRELLQRLPSGTCAGPALGKRGHTRNGIAQAVGRIGCGRRSAPPAPTLGLRGGRRFDDGAVSRPWPHLRSGRGCRRRGGCRPCAPSTPHGTATGRRRRGSRPRWQGRSEGGAAEASAGVGRTELGIGRSSVPPVSSEAAGSKFGVLSGPCLTRSQDSAPPHEAALVEPIFVQTSAGIGRTRLGAAGTM